MLTSPRARLRAALVAPLLVTTALAGHALAGGVPPLPATVRPGPVTLVVGGYGTVTVDVRALWDAEWRLEHASGTERTRVYAALAPDLRAAAVWDLTHGLTEGPTTTTVRSIPYPCHDADCENGVPSDPEPPVNPPPTKLPDPVPQPTCFLKEDVRTATGGLVFKKTVYKFHQYVSYCADGQVIEPDFFVYTSYSNLDLIWQCQDPDDDLKQGFTLAPNLLHAHAQGECWWEFGIGPLSAHAGHTRPLISDTYGSDGTLVTRTGSSY
jgi:hypothetical protein